MVGKGGGCGGCGDIGIGGYGIDTWRNGVGYDIDSGDIDNYDGLQMVEDGCCSGGMEMVVVNVGRWS